MATYDVNDATMKDNKSNTASEENFFFIYKHI